MRPCATENAGKKEVPGSTSPSGTQASQGVVSYCKSFFGGWNTRRRLPDTYEAYRVEEPPQSRLIRLHGLFDTLLDHDDDASLAGGRAKQEWRERASRARYGAGGPLATGSLVLLHDSKDLGRGSVSVSTSATIREWFSFVRRQSYAAELLARCRENHREMEQSLYEARLHRKTSSDYSASRLWNHLLYLSRGLHEDPENTPLNVSRAEAGWRGSRVWGLLVPMRENKPSTSQLRARQREIEWEGFLAYAEVQERELYQLFQDLDRNCDGLLDEDEISHAFERAGIHMNKSVLEDFVASLASYSVYNIHELQGGKHSVSFPEFRDYLLLLPRQLTMVEILRFYQVRKAVGLFGTEGIFAELGAGWGKTSRGASAVNHDGDVSLAGDERMTDEAVAIGEKQEHLEREAGEEKDSNRTSGHVFSTGLAFKFLLAGGIAGAVSRTFTAPLDRLKVFMITNNSNSTPQSVLRSLAEGITTLYAQGGLRTFWLGNGLNCIKIFPVRNH